MSPALSPGHPLLSVHDLRTHFATSAGELRAVDGVSFDVQAGEVVGLVGESGSGKSVTGFSILSLIDPPGRIVSGSIRLRGEELVGASPARMRQLRGAHLAMVFQDPMATLNPVLRVSQQMFLALSAHQRLSRAAARARSVEALDKVGIPDASSRLDAYPHQFSGGMRQRVAIAIALLNHPDLIVCDEPTTALDVSIQAQILEQMRMLASESGTALIWISHDLAVVSSLASRVIVMYAGRIVEAGPAPQVLADPRHPYTLGLLESLPARAAPGQPLRQIPGITPSLIDLDAGCAFRSRCSRTTERCATAPPNTSLSGRDWRCHHPIMSDASVSKRATDSAGQAHAS